MKTFIYIWRNIRRNPIRSLLTILSVGFSLALMTVLYGFLASQETWKNGAAQANRIVVMNIQGFSGKLPISSVDDVRSTKFVAAAVPFAWYGGSYQDEQMPFAQFATDPECVFEVWPEYSIPPEQLAAFKENRQGCVLDRRIAERRGWKVGDRIPLKGTIYPFSLDLEISGIFDSPKNTDSLYFHWDYLNEGLKQLNYPNLDNAGTIFARVSNSESIPTVIKSIDDKFGSSDTPTRSQTEAAFAQMFVDMLGNVQVLIRNIGLAVVFSLSLVTANSMAMAMRERVTEIAVLKAIGFPRSRVLFMVLGEACAIAMLGGFLGVGMGCLFLQGMNRLMPQFFPFTVMEMMGPWVSYGLIAAAALGLISGIVPAIRAAQMSVIDGLRRVA
ncbi:MAG: ABC transporter permease [Fuerstia sp.]|nr:ABC transporter permease [Fuerstiella sp.]